MTEEPLWSGVAPELVPPETFDRNMHMLRVADPVLITEVIDAWRDLFDRRLRFRRYLNSASMTFRVLARFGEDRCKELRAELEASVAAYLADRIKRLRVEAAVRAIREFID